MTIAPRRESDATKTTVGKWCYAHAVVDVRLWLRYPFLPLDVSGVLPERESRAD